MITIVSHEHDSACCYRISAIWRYQTRVWCTTGLSLMAETVMSFRKTKRWNVQAPRNVRPFVRRQYSVLSNNKTARRCDLSNICLILVIELVPTCWNLIKTKQMKNLCTKTSIEVLCTKPSMGSLLATFKIYLHHTTPVDPSGRKTVCFYISRMTFDRKTTAFWKGRAYTLEQFTIVLAECKLDQHNLKTHLFRTAFF